MFFYHIWNGGHPGHMTRIIYIHTGFPFDIKFDFDWPCGFREDTFENVVALYRNGIMHMFNIFGPI